MVETFEGLSKREAILRSAFMVFTEKGFHKAKVSDVAELAKVGKGTVYEYFSSKEDLLRGVIEAGIKYYMNELEKSAQGPDLPWDKIKHAIRKHADLQRENENLSQIMFNNFGVMTEEFHQFLIENRQEFISKLQHMVEKGIEAGQIIPMSAEVGARIILGSMMSIHCVTGCLNEQEVEEMLDTLGRALLVTNES